MLLLSPSEWENPLSLTSPLGCYWNWFCRCLYAELSFTLPCRTIDLMVKRLTSAWYSVLFLQVIYALNTKNDEHEEEIESLKEAHEDEVWTQTQRPDTCYVCDSGIWIRSSCLVLVSVEGWRLFPAWQRAAVGGERQQAILCHTAILVSRLTVF